MKLDNILLMAALAGVAVVVGVGIYELLVGRGGVESAKERLRAIAERLSIIRL